MIRLRLYFGKILGKDRDKNFNDHVAYNPQNIEKVLKKFDELNCHINALEKSLKEAENKTSAYEDILLKYERIFKEEIALYRLHKSNISVLNQTFNENELFLHEIQHQIQSFVDIESKHNNKNEKTTSFKRILSRFFHQNELHKSRVNQKLTELNETIEQKNRLLERMHGEIETWYNRVNSSLLPSQRIPINQAYG